MPLPSPFPVEGSRLPRLRIQVLTLRLAARVEEAGEGGGRRLSPLRLLVDRDGRDLDRESGRGAETWGLLVPGEGPGACE